MAAPRVSIVTPTYRHAQFIASTIESVRNQTFQDWEMLVLDDGSDDGTAIIAEAFRDPRIRVFREPHRGIEGLAETYNLGLAEARGDLIAILEGDDLWKLEKLALQVPDFDQSEVVLSAGRMEIRIGSELSPYLAPMYLPDDEALRNQPLGRAGMTMMRPRMLTFTFPLTVVMRRSALERAGGFRKPDYLPLVDYPTFLAMSIEGKWSFHDHVLGTWRRHEQSITKSNFPDILEGVYRYATKFAKENRSRLALTSVDLAKLDREWLNFQIERLILLARASAADKKYGKAARAFQRAKAFSPGRNTKLMLNAAIASCRARVSPEWAMRLGMRAPWTIELKSFGVDPLVHRDGDPEFFAIRSFSDAGSNH